MNLRDCIVCGNTFEAGDTDAAICPLCSDPPIETTISSGAHLPKSEPAGESPEEMAGPLATPKPEIRGSAWRVGDVILELYEVRQIFTAGGMGLVYRVHHRNWNVDLALKSPRPEIFTGPGGKQSFVREAETWVDLGLHPHIVSCYYVRSIDDIPRVFAEFVEGGSLKDWIEDKRLYQGGKDKALERILDIGIQFAWGLAYAHDKGLVHQDVKPANVLMTDDGVAKVSDFGLTKGRAAAGEAARPEVAAVRILVSSGGYTPAYCSPEQARQEPVSRTTDAWSWAVSILEMFTGEVTWYRGTAALEALEEYIEAGPTDLALPVMPPALADLLRACLQKAADQRPQDMQAIARRLQEIYAKETGNPYLRQAPKAAELRADTLNNKALTQLDLGNTNEAWVNWKSALEIEPYHLESSFNFGMLRWRNGHITDDELVEQLTKVRATQADNWLSAYVLGIVNLERGDRQAAEAAFALASQLNPKERDEIEKALRLSRELPGAYCMKTIEMGATNSLAVAQDGKLVGTVAQSFPPTLWDVNTDKAVFRISSLAEEELPVMAVSENARFILEGGGDEIRLWDMIAVRLARLPEDRRPTIFDLESSLRALAISPDNQHAVAGTADGSVLIYDLKAEDLVAILPGHQGDVRCASFSKDGKWVITGGDDGKILISDLKKQDAISELSGPPVWSVALSPDQHWLLSGCRDHSMQLWDVQQQQCAHIFLAHKDEVRCVAFSKDGKAALSGSRDGTLRLWDIPARRCLRTFSEHNSPVIAAAFLSGTGGNLQAISAGEEGEVKLWEMAGLGSERGYWRVCLPTSASAALSRAKTAVSKKDELKEALAKGALEIARSALLAARQVPGFEHDAELLEMSYQLGARIGRRKKFIGAKLVRTIKDHVDTVDQSAVTQDGKFLVGDGRDIGVWALPEGRYLYSLEAEPYAYYPPRPIVLTPDSRSLVAIVGNHASSWGAGPELGVWDLAAGKWEHTLAHQANVLDFQLLPGGKGLVSLSLKSSPEEAVRVIRTWDLKSGDLTSSIDCLSEAYRLLVSSDGRFTLLPESSSFTTEPKLSVISLNDGLSIASFADLYPPVAISPDPEYALASQSARLVLICLKDGVTIGRADKSAFGDIRPSAVRFMPDGAKYLTPYQGGIGVWETKSGELVEHLIGRGNNVFSLPAEDGGWVFSAGAGKSQYEAIEQINLWGIKSAEPLYMFKGLNDCYSFSLFNHDRCLAASGRKAIQVFQLEWEYEFPEMCDWDEGARPYLEIFLKLHGFRDGDQPAWSEFEFNQFLIELGRRGYGWLRPEGVRQKLVEMAGNRY